MDANMVVEADPDFILSNSASSIHALRMLQTDGRPRSSFI